MLNLHQLSDPKVQLNITKVNNGESNDIARSYKRRHWSYGKTMAILIEIRGELNNNNKQMSSYVCSS